jgi:hypothetical protein
VTERDLLIDCLRRLNRSATPYMLTGSMASNYWGIPRTTHDLDFVIQLPVSGISRLVDAFHHDFELDERAVHDAYKPPFQFNAIDTRSALKVDFWLLRPEPFEREMFARRQRVELFGEPAWIATAEDVILHKLYWHSISPQDRQLADAAGIVAVQSAKLDLEYLRRWAAKMGVQTILDQIFSGDIRPKQT